MSKEVTFKIWGKIKLGVKYIEIGWGQGAQIRDYERFSETIIPSKEKVQRHTHSLMLLVGG